MLSKTETIQFLLDFPAEFGKQVGFTKLTSLHDTWMKRMLDTAQEDSTLQAHRGSYKTTCLSIVIAILMVLRPSLCILFMRKTDTDVKEIINQVKKILLSEPMQYYSRCIYGVPVKLVRASATELTTNLSIGTRGTSQLVGIGSKSSITGKHFDLIFTDDIVNVEDRTSTAERERIKLVYQELQNIKNRGGRIFNTGTPWHKDDAFCLMPNPEKWDCYSTGLIDDDQLTFLKEHMTRSLFAANYELRHVAAEDVLFSNPRLHGDPANVMQGVSHVDSAFGGGDSTALTILRKVGEDYFVFGQKFPRHVNDVMDTIVNYHNQFQAGKMWNETNADKGLVAQQLHKRGIRVVTYSESQNKFYKISSILKYLWPHIVFVEGTDPAYIDEILDFNENAEHDDCPDSLASLIREAGKHAAGGVRSIPGITA